MNNKMEKLNSIRNKKTMRISLLVRIFVQEDQNLPFHLANAVKYICRAGKKNPYKIAEDLQKAIWYINRYIDLVEDKPEPKTANEPGGNDHV